MFAKWIQRVEEMGELKIIEGAGWDLEIAALSVLASKQKENGPALLFDRIKDYPHGYRILVGFFESLKHSALTTNLPPDVTREGFIQAWRERLAKSAYITPRCAVGLGTSGDHVQQRIDAEAANHRTSRNISVDAVCRVDRLLRQR